MNQFKFLTVAGLSVCVGVASFNPALVLAKRANLDDPNALIAASKMGPVSMQSPAVNVPAENRLLNALPGSVNLDKLAALSEELAAPAKTSEEVVPRTQKVALISPVSTVPVPQQDQSILFKAGVKSTQENIDLTVNKAEIINLKMPISRVAISQSEIASILVLSPTQIQLLGRKVGVANLLIWPSAGSSNYTSVDIVVHRDVSALARQLQLIDPNIKVVPMAAEDSVILTGQVDSMDASQLAAQLAKAFFTQGDAPTPAASGKTGTSSQVPGSSTPNAQPNVINLIQVNGQPSTKLEMARTKLRQIDPNINLDIVPGPDGIEKAVLTGRVSNPATISEAINTASIFYGQPGLKVLTGPGGNLIRQTGNGTFQQENAFSDNVDINILQGSVVTDATGNVISMMKVAHKPQVKCSIKFLDISRRDVNQMGATLTGQNGNIGYGHFSGAQSAVRPFSSLNGTISGSQSGSGWINGSGTGGSGSGTASALAQLFGSGTTQVLTLNRNMAIAMSAFMDKRKIRALAEPTLTMLSGEKASFLAGGEIPIPMVSGLGQINVTYKEFGIRLNIIPTVTADNKIHLQIAPEVSSIDPANSIVANGISIPGLKTRRMQTTLELKDHQSFVLAGLFNREEVEAASRFPGLGDVPILGTFFRQKNRDRLDNEMMVLITPEIVYDDTDVEISSEDQQLMQNAEGDRQNTIKKRLRW